MLESHHTLLLIEDSLVCPRATINIEDHQITILFEMRQFRQFASTFMPHTFELHFFEFGGFCKIEITEAIGIFENRRSDDQAFFAGREHSGAESVQRNIFTFRAIFHGFAV